MHDNLELRVREKTVRQMTRSGLVESSLSRKNRRRISSRTTDDELDLKSRETELDPPDSVIPKNRAHQKKLTYQKNGESRAADHQNSGHSQDLQIQSTNHLEALETPADTVLENEEDLSSSDQLRKATHPALNEDHAAGHAQTEALIGREKAKRKLQKKRVYQERRPEKSGRLRFGDEQPNQAISKPLAKATAQNGGIVAGSLAKAATPAESVVHKQVSEGEKDNVGVQAAHQSEIVAEATVRTAVDRVSDIRSRSDRLSSHSRNSKLEPEMEKPSSKLRFESSQTEAESVQGVSLAKGQQKKRIKRQYAEGLKAAQAGGEFAATSALPYSSAISRLKNGITDLARGNKGMAAFVGSAVAILLMFIGAFGTFGSMFSQMEGAVVESTYLADDNDIRKAERAYADMENALQAQIERIKRENPDYDEYRFQIDEISHNPYHLISYLTVKYGDFSYSQVKRELEEIFREQYHLTSASDTYTETVTKTVRVGDSLGRVVTSGYCNCPICCGIWSGGPTASGVYPTPDHTIAVDAYSPLVPLGTHIIMNGTEYVVEDTGDFARYGVQFDVYYDSHAEATSHGHQSWEAFLADSNGSNTVQVTQTTTVKRLSVTVSNSNLDLVLRNRMNEDETKRYMIYNATYGNRDYLFSIETLPAYGGMSYDIPPEALSDSRFAAMIREAEKYLGYPYVWGGASPETSFDCSGYVSWVVNHCGNGWDFGRLTAEGLRNVCTYVSPSEAKPGDLVFFQGTYDTAGASHCAIYVGNGMMIHCGNPIQYTSMQSAYWQQHFYCYGRLP